MEKKNVFPDAPEISTTVVCLVPVTVLLGEYRRQLPELSLAPPTDDASV
jgi:hypothetical protein